MEGEQVLIGMRAPKGFSAWQRVRSAQGGELLQNAAASRTPTGSSCAWSNHLAIRGTCVERTLEALGDCT